MKIQPGEDAETEKEIMVKRMLPPRMITTTNQTRRKIQMNLLVSRKILAI